MAHKNQILGIYSKNIKDYTGTGATMKKHEHKTYYYVVRSSHDEYHVQPLNMQNIPATMVTTMPRNEFVSAYTPEIDYYQRNPISELEKLNDLLKYGEAMFTEEETDEEIKPLLKGLLLDPKKPKTATAPIQYTSENFKILSSIVQILIHKDDKFIEEQRQEFNSVAISLRKQELIEEAITFYNKALEISKNDENLHFNVARAYFELGETAEALMHIDKALEISPDLKSAMKFKKYLMRKGRT